MNSANPMNVDALMTRIRAEVAKRKFAANPSADRSGAASAVPRGEPVALSPLPLPQLPKAQFVTADRFHLNDFLCLHDADFIDAAYRGVLKRATDEQGVQHFLASLRNGTLSKIEVLGRLRYSPEGRKQAVKIKGLLPAFASQHLTRVPIIGAVFASVMALVRLPRIARILQGLEAYQHQRNAELEAAIRNLATAADTNERQLAAAISNAATSEFHQSIQARLVDLDKRAESALSELRTLTPQVSNAIESIQTRIAEQISEVMQSIQTQAATQEAWRNDTAQRLATVESLKREIDTQLVDAIALSQQTSAQLAATLRETLGAIEQRVEGFDKALQAEQGQLQNAHLRLIERIARIEGRVHEQAERFIGPASPAPSAEHNADEIVPVSSPSRFDKIYFAFEQRFRGSREDIRERLKYYLPLLTDSVVAKEAAVVLDIGCGRGEWLEVLRDHQINARGIDTNAAMASECVALGLDVEVGDALARLRQMPDNALGAITGFHIVEHIPLEALLELIEQAHRVVQPGGLVIFETPNPENISVAACNFYMDPTHQRPLPPPLLQFLVEAGGFVDVDIHRVNAALLPKVFGEPSEDDPPALRATLKFLRRNFSSAPDYSVVGHVA